MGCVSVYGGTVHDATAIDSLMRTTFTGRAFTDEDVPDELIAEVLGVARFAPSGGNRQGWRVVVVRDRDTKRRVVECGVPALRVYLAQIAAGENPFSTVAGTSVDIDAVMADESVDVSWFRNLAGAPVLLVIGVDLSVVASVDRWLDRIGVASGASIYPFVQNINLAARARGLTTALTTFPAAGEPELKTLLALPDTVAVAATVPMGWPVRELTKLTRNPVSSFARLERWDGDPLRDTSR